MNALAEKLGFLVAYPRQSKAANVQKCWNWFRPGDQERGRGEPALVAGLIDDIFAAEHVDRARIYAAGLSAGGAAAAVLADAYPDLFAAVGVHSGIGCDIARDLPSALTAMRQGAKSAGRRQPSARRFVPLITFHGDCDPIVHEVNARDMVVAAAAGTGTPCRVTTETGAANGRRYERALTCDDAGKVVIEQWTVFGAGHVWCGGDPARSYADPAGPNASRAIVEFFLQHRRKG